MYKRQSKYNVSNAATPFAVLVGGNSFKHSKAGQRVFPCIVIDSVPILAFVAEDDFVLLDLRFHDPAGNVILDCVRGEVSISTGVWDYKLEGGTLMVNSQHGEATLQLLYGPNSVCVQRGLFFGPTGTTLRIDMEGMYIQDIINNSHNWYVNRYIRVVTTPGRSTKLGFPLI